MSDKVRRKNLHASRQAKSTPKTRFHFLVETASYDWLSMVAKVREISVAAALNDLLRSVRSGKMIERQ